MRELSHVSQVLRDEFKRSEVEPRKNVDHGFPNGSNSIRPPLEGRGVLSFCMRGDGPVHLGGHGLSASGGHRVGRGSNRLRGCSDRSLDQTLSEIDLRLRCVATARPGSDIPAAPLPGQTGAELGWNRLARRLQQTDSDTVSLDSRLATLVEGQRHDELSTILNSLPDGIAATNAEGRIGFVNNAFPSIFGISDGVEQLDGTDMETLLRQGTDDAGPVDRLLDDDAHRRTVVAELGTSAKRVLRAVRIPIRSQQPGSAVWSIRDATQQKLADKMRNEFIDAATHELRTPLANIKAYAETLSGADKIDLESQKEFSNTINTEATRLARLVDDLLSISSMEVGSLTVDRQNVDTGRLLGEAVEKVQPLFEKNGVAFECILPDKMPELLLDKDKISASIVNLLGNAAKYTPAGGGASLRASLSDDTLQIEITDSGMGISEEELPRIFDKFFRSSDARVQEQSGTGLGLSLAREVVRLHSGTLTVTSELNAGTTFVVTLPRE